MTVAVLLGLVGVGLGAGLLSGLIGIGGGVLIVPFLYFLYAHPEWFGFQVAQPLHAVVAHATSLFVIVPTAVHGAYHYHRAGLVAWRAALPVAAASVLAAVVGARLAPLVPATALKLGFAVFVLGAGLQLLTGRQTARPPLGPRGGLARAVVVGVLVGFFSVLLGLGGGLVAIPLMISYLRFELDAVAGTSMGIIAFTALAGSISYAVTGWGAAGLPAGSWGYVHALVGLPILIGSMVAVPWGTRLNRRLGTRGLRWLFGLLLIVLGGFLAVQNLLALLRASG